MCDDDDWVNLAMADDSKVVHLLLLLHHHQPPPPPPHLHLHWTVRQHRSRSLPRIKLDPTTTTRASPTTPLSWSGGAVDGYEDSSHPTKHAQTSRSKIANPSDTTTAKKSRRKKTLAELKEEENLLLQERKSLKNKLAYLHHAVEKHRATNESLKKMKHGLDSRPNTKSATTIFEVQCHNPSTSVSQKTLTHVSAANASSKPKEIRNQESTFVFPDLNLPVEDDFSSNAIMHCIC